MDSALDQLDQLGVALELAERTEEPALCATGGRKAGQAGSLAAKAQVQAEANGHGHGRGQAASS